MNKNSVKTIDFHYYFSLNEYFFGWAKISSIEWKHGWNQGWNTWLFLIEQNLARLSESKNQSLKQNKVSSKFYPKNSLTYTSVKCINLIKIITQNKFHSFKIYKSQRQPKYQEHVQQHTILYKA